MGDQIYADRLLSEWRKHHQSNSNIQDENAYQQLLEQYRQVYRITFGQPDTQQALRNAANWMLLDDHDIFNNVDYYYLARDPDVAIVYKAGIRAFYEYQRQLMEDIPEDPFSTTNRVDFVREIMGTAFIHLDLRNYRTIALDPRHPMEWLSVTSSTRTNTPILKNASQNSAQGKILNTYLLFPLFLSCS